MTMNVEVSTEVSTLYSMFFQSIDLCDAFWMIPITLADGDVDIPPRME